MATSQALASLIVELGLNSASLRTQLDEARGFASKFGDSMKAAFSFDGVEKMAKAVKRASAEVAQAGLGLAAVAGGAVALAAKVDPAVAAAVKDLKGSFTDLAVPVAQMVVPAMQDLARHVRDVADFVAGLSPHTKEMISTFLQIAAVTGGAALVISKVAGAVSGLAAVLGALTAAPFLLVIAGVAAVGAAVVVLHKAWRENWGGMQEDVRDVIAWMVDGWGSFRTWFSGFLDSMIDGWAAVEKAISRALNLQKALTPGSGWSVAELPKMNRNSDAVIDQWSEGLKSADFAGQAVKFGAMLKDKLLEGVKAAGKELVIIGDELKAKIGFAAGSAQRFGGGGSGGHKLNEVDLRQADEIAAKAIADLAATLSEGNRKIWSTIQEADDKIAAEASKAAASAAEAMAAVVRDAAAAEAGARKEALNHWTLTTTKANHEWRTAGENISVALAGLGQMLLSKLGDVGQVINSAIEGFKTAGPWGAVIAVIGEILSRLQVFTEFAEMLNKSLFEALGKLSKVLEPLFAMLTTIYQALEPLEAFVHSLITILFQALKPVFDLIGGVVSAVMKMIGPVLNVFSQLTKAFGPIFDKLTAVDGILAPLIKIFDGVGKTVTQLFDGLSPLIGVVLGLFDALSPILDQFSLLGPILDVIAGIFRFVGLTINLTILGILTAVESVMSGVGMNTAAIKAQIATVTSKVNGFDLLKDPNTAADTSVGKKTGGGLMGENQKNPDGSPLAGSGSTGSGSTGTSRPEESSQPTRPAGTTASLASPWSDAAATRAAWDAAKNGLSDVADAAKKVADKFGELLVNLPSGYKIRAAQFAATNAGSLGFGPQFASATMGQQPVNFYGPVTIAAEGATSLRELALAIQAKTQTEMKRSSRNGATKMRGGP